MTLRFSTGARNAMLGGPGLTPLIDGGSAAGILRLYTGAQPASANNAATGTLLATLTFNDPSFAAPSAGSCVMDNTPVPAGVGVAAGTAGWFRISDSALNTVVDGTVSASGGGGDFEINTVTVSVGLDLWVESGVIAMPES